jgi:hypothetical protein
VSTLGSKDNPFEVLNVDVMQVRLRCIEAAARHAIPHPDGYAAGILAAAKGFSAWVLEGDKPAEGVAGLL